MFDLLPVDCVEVSLAVDAEEFVEPGEISDGLAVAIFDGVPAVAEIFVDVAEIFDTESADYFLAEAEICIKIRAIQCCLPSYNISAAFKSFSFLFTQAYIQKIRNFTPKSA